MNEVRPELQNKIDNYSEQVFPTNTRFTVITSQIIKKLKPQVSHSLFTGFKH
jgi:hypothetical protein